MKLKRFETEEELTKKRKITGIVFIIIFVLFSVVVGWFIGKPMLEFIANPYGFREWVDSNGMLGRVAFLGMMALQVIIAIIPGEPLEIGAGYAFGAVEGTVLCLLGAMIGGSIIFLFVRRTGNRVVRMVFAEEKIKKLKFLQNSKKLDAIIFILFFIPGTPKDVLTYIVGLTPTKLWTYLLISTVARIPSVITSTIGGNALGIQDYSFAVIVFAITAVVSIIGVVVYKKIIEKHSDKEKHH